MDHAPQYLQGFGNYFESEAVAGVLLPGHHSPQKVPYGLYTEQLSGTAFAVPRHLNRHSWLYRILPSVRHGEFKKMNQTHWAWAPIVEALTPPTQMRWDPLPYPKKKTHFVQGLLTLAANGNVASRSGAAIHLYAINQSMEDVFLLNSEGEFLIVPQEGRLILKTELGTLLVEPGEIAVIPRGMCYQVMCQTPARGYVCENFGEIFRLPELGILGANGLASAGDFQIPTACYEERQGNFELINKFQGQLWVAPMDHSPLNVVAWRGNYTPYKYALKHFNAINTVSFDHPDPSIFTVLTSSSAMPGIANVDFVIFPPRWTVATDTLRLPYFHRNVMSEFMGLIRGSYEARLDGFVPGGSSLHNAMSAHGPDAEAYQKAISTDLQPQYLADTLAFMFESSSVWQLTSQALSAKFRKKDYLECWQSLPAVFTRPSSC